MGTHYEGADRNRKTVELAASPKCATHKNILNGTGTESDSKHLGTADHTNNTRLDSRFKQPIDARWW